MSWQGLAIGTVATNFPPSEELNECHWEEDGQQASPGKQRHVWVPFKGECEALVQAAPSRTATNAEEETILFKPQSTLCKESRTKVTPTTLTTRVSAEATYVGLMNRCGPLLYFGEKAQAENGSPVHPESHQLESMS